MQTKILSVHKNIKRQNKAIFACLPFLYNKVDVSQGHILDLGLSRE